MQMLRPNLGKRVDELLVHAIAFVFTRRAWGGFRVQAIGELARERDQIVGVDVGRYRESGRATDLQKPECEFDEEVFHYVGSTALIGLPADVVTAAVCDVVESSSL